MDGSVVSSLLSQIKYDKKKKKEDIYDPIIVNFAGLDITFVNRYTLYTHHPTFTTRLNGREKNKSSNNGLIFFETIRLRTKPQNSYVHVHMHAAVAVAVAVHDAFVVDVVVVSN